MFVVGMPTKAEDRAAPSSRQLRTTVNSNQYDSSSSQTEPCADRERVGSVLAWEYTLTHIFGTLGIY